MTTEIDQLINIEMEKLKQYDINKIKHKEDVVELLKQFSDYIFYINNTVKDEVEFTFKYQLNPLYYYVFKKSITKYDSNNYYYNGSTSTDLNDIKSELIREIAKAKYEGQDFNTYKKRPNIFSRLAKKLLD